MSILLMGIGLMAGASAQEKVLTEDFFAMGNELGVGARAMGLGGAYSAVADDYTAMYWNPAGLGQMKRREFNLGFSQNSVKSEADFLGAVSQTTTSFTRLNSVGLVFPVPTSRGSLVFGFGYDKMRDADAMVDAGALTADSLFQTNSILDEGNRSQLTFSGAIEVGPNLFFGTSINFIDGEIDHSAEFKEDDIYDLYFLPGDEADPTDDADWAYYSSTDILNTDLDGTNLKLGLLYRSESIWRLGATVSLPTTYTVTENWRWSEEEYYDADHDAWSDGNEGTYKYQYTEPYAVSLGLSARLLDLILLSADAEFKDWTQTKFKDDPPISGMDQAKANRAIKLEMEATSRLHAGAELYVPATSLRLRGGIFKDPSPYIDKTIRPDRTFYSGGISFMMDRQAMLDLTYVRGSWQETNTNTPSAGPITLDRSLQKVVATLSLRF
jgi:long-subunit fatty acid transport protein